MPGGMSADRTAGRPSPPEAARDRYLYHQAERVRLYLGDAAQVLAALPERSVDCVVTSPPYWQHRDYATGAWAGGGPGCRHHRLRQSETCARCGARSADPQYGLEDTVEDYIAHLRGVFAPLRRVLTTHGTCWLSLGDSTGRPGGPPAKNLLGVPWRVALAMQEDGWILRSSIIWHKPNAMPESVRDRLACTHEHLFLLARSPRYHFDLDPIRIPLACPDAADGTRVFHSRTLPLSQAARPLRVAIYIRISTDEEHQPFSLEAQDKRLRAYAGTQPGWDVATVFRDEASGATLERPDLQRALAAARAGRFDVLLVYRVDRLARSLRGLVHILDDLDAAGVVFRSATEPFDTATPVGRMLVQMLGVFAQFERETIIDRVINGMERKAARGQWCGGYRPYGYQPDPATDLLRPVPEESPLVPLIFNLYVSGRHGTKALAGELNRRGHRTRHGKPWSAQAVLTVLRNRAYLGEVYFRGTWYRAEHHHPPLVEPDIFEQAQQIMIARGDDRSRRAASSSTYILAGRVICDRCGKRYLGAAANGRTSRYGPRRRRHRRTRPHQTRHRATRPRSPHPRTRPHPRNLPNPPNTTNSQPAVDGSRNGWVGAPEGIRTPALLRYRIGGDARLADYLSDRFGELGERRGDPQCGTGVDAEVVVGAAQGTKAWP
jgi:DNA invertase Pin-like site-specific DNA recombinase